MIELQNLSYSYRKKAPAVLSGVSLLAPDGACTVIVGENGSGKSTLVGILAGVLTPTSGSVRVTGRVGYVPQEASLFEDMTVKENLIFFTRLAKTAVPTTLPFGVNGFLGKRVSDLSGGMKKRVSIVCALLQKPDILLLDEPCASLDGEFFAELQKTVLRLRGEGVCVLYIGHHEEEYLPFCDKRYRLKDASLEEFPISAT